MWLFILIFHFEVCHFYGCVLNKISFLCVAANLQDEDKKVLRVKVRVILSFFKIFDMSKRSLTQVEHAEQHWQDSSSGKRVKKLFISHTNESGVSCSLYCSILYDPLTFAQNVQ